MQWDAASPDTAALFSLAVPALANALQLRAFAEPGGAVHLALVVRGHHAPFRAAFRADGHWHHVCATWEQLGGRWALFADGRRCAGARGLGAGHPLPPGGILVLGQDQDSLGGGFSARDAFSGNLTDFHLWARTLSPVQLNRARSCAPPLGGLLFRWDLGALDVTPSLLPPVWVRLFCPGTAAQPPGCQPPPTFWLQLQFPGLHRLLFSLGDPAHLLQTEPRPTLATPSPGLQVPMSPPNSIRGHASWGPLWCAGAFQAHWRWIIGPMGSQDASLTALPPWPVPSEECPTWDPGPRTESPLLCLQQLPFLCCYGTGKSLSSCALGMLMATLGMDCCRLRGSR